MTLLRDPAFTFMRTDPAWRSIVRRGGVLLLLCPPLDGRWLWDTGVTSRWP